MMFFFVFFIAGRILFCILLFFGRFPLQKEEYLNSTSNKEQKKERIELVQQ